MKNLSGIVSTVLLAGASLALSTHAFAGDLKIAYSRDGAPTTKVAVADLDLSKPSDVQALYVRVQEAAGAVCDAELSNKKMAPPGWRKQCVKSAVAGAVKQVDDEWLAILLRGMPSMARL